MSKPMLDVLIPYVVAVDIALLISLFILIMLPTKPRTKKGQNK